MPTRRSLLRGIGGGLGVAAAGSVAGCTRRRRGRSAPAYVDPLYDPGELVDVGTAGFTAYDLGTLYDRRSLLGEDAAEAIDRFDGRFDAFDATEFGLATAQSYTTRSVESIRDRLSPVSGEAPVGLSVTIEGSYRPDAMREELDAFVGLTERDGPEGYDVYGVDSVAGPAAEDLPSTALAISEGTVVLGASSNLEVDGQTVLETAIDARGDAGYYRSNDDLAALTDAVGDAVAVTGVVGDLGTVADDLDVEAGRPLLSGLRAAGAGTTLGEGETLFSTIAGVYEDGRTPTESELSAAREYIRQESDRVRRLDQVETTVDGRTATASLDAQVSAVRDRNLGIVLSGVVGLTYLLPVAAFLTLIEERDPIGTPRPPTPQVAWQFDYDPETSPALRIRHEGGDTVDADDLAVRVEGEGTVRLKDREEFVAGDQIVAATEGLSSGDRVLLVWTRRTPEGQVIGRFEVP